MHAAGSFLPVLNAEAGVWAVRMGHASLVGGLLLGGVGVVCRGLPRLPAALRASLWWLALLKLTLDLCSVASLPLPVLPEASARRVAQTLLPPAAPAASFRFLPAGTAFPRKAGPVSDDTEARRVSSASGEAVSWPLRFQILWLAGVLLCARRAAHQGRKLRRLVQGAAPADVPLTDVEALAAAIGLHHPPRILESNAVAAPCVTGGFRPVILLPLGLADSLSLDEMRLALAHEMAHVRRHDLPLAWLPALAQSLFFFHPLAWLGAKEWAAAREEACDALALSVTGVAPGRLGHLLLKMAGDAAHTPALGLSPGHSTLRRRLLGLLERPAHCRQARWLLAAALLNLLPWRLTAAVRSHSSADKSANGPTLHYAITDLGEAGEAAGLNTAGQAALTLRDGDEAQGMVGSAQAQTALGALPKHHWSIAYGINSAGQVAAASYNIPGHGRAFLWNGSPHRLGSLPGYPYSEARAVNDAGQVAGFAETGAYDRRQAHITRAFLWQSGEMTDLGTLGGPYSAAYGLNSQGQVVGKADTETFGQTHAFVWENGQMQDLGTLGGANSLACRVSDGGVVVGCAETGTGDVRHAFAWQNGMMRDLGALPALPDSVACGVSETGQIVGYAELQPGASVKRAVLWRNGQAFDLNALLPRNSGWVLEEARAVNDRGQIAGNGMLNGQARAFLLTPR